MDILAVSVWLRYLELCGENVPFPENGYRGEYIYDISRIVRVEHGAGVGQRRHAGRRRPPGTSPALGA